MKSPHMAPSPPNKAVPHSELIWLISARAAMAGAVVKTEVKKNPEMKLFRKFISRVEMNSSWSTPVFMRITAMRMLNTIMPVSLITFFTFLSIADLEIYRDDRVNHIPSASVDASRNEPYLRIFCFQDSTNSSNSFLATESLILETFSVSFGAMSAISFLLSLSLKSL